MKRVFKLISVYRILFWYIDFYICFYFHCFSILFQIFMWLVNHSTLLDLFFLLCGFLIVCVTCVVNSVCMCNWMFLSNFVCIFKCMCVIGIYFIRFKSISIIFRTFFFEPVKLIYLILIKNGKYLCFNNYISKCYLILIKNRKYLCFDNYINKMSF